MDHGTRKFHRITAVNKQRNTAHTENRRDASNFSQNIMTPTKIGFDVTPVPRSESNQVGRSLSCFIGVTIVEKGAGVGWGNIILKNFPTNTIPVVAFIITSFEQWIPSIRGYAF